MSTDTPVPAVGSTDPAMSEHPSLEIMSHHSYVDGGWFHIVGEIRNNGSTPLEFVKIVATLYDADKTMLGSDFTYTELEVIPPGGKSPFRSGTDTWTGIASYSLQAQASPGTLPSQDLVILSHASYTEGDWLHVGGEVANTGSTPAEFVKLIITLYDAGGQVVGADFTYSELDTIPAGGTSPFESGTDHWTNFDHYEIQVQGE